MVCFNFKVWDLPTYKAPVVQVIHERFGIVSALMTVHLL